MRHLPFAAAGAFFYSTKKPGWLECIPVIVTEGSHCCQISCNVFKIYSHPVRVKALKSVVSMITLELNVPS